MERKIFWFLDKVVKYGNSHDNHPVFNIPEEIMKMFVEEQEEKE